MSGLGLGIKEGPCGLPLPLDPLFPQGSALFFVQTSPSWRKDDNDSKVAVIEVEKKRQWREADLFHLKRGSLSRE